MLGAFTAENVTAIVVAFVTVAIPSTVAAVVSIRNRRDIKTGNGKSAGQTIGATAQTVEVVQAQQHAIVGEFEQVHSRLGRIEEKVDRLDGRVDRVDTRLEKHLTEGGT